MIKLIEERNERPFAAIYEERTSYDDKLYSHCGDSHGRFGKECDTKVINTYD